MPDAPAIVRLYRTGHGHGILTINEPGSYLHSLTGGFCNHHIAGSGQPNADGARFVEADVSRRPNSTGGARCAPSPRRTSAFHEFHVSISDPSRTSPSGAVAT
jgi:hypothetical protein